MSGRCGANAQMAQDTDFNETGPGHHIISPIAQTAISVAERTGSSGKNQVIAKFTAQAAGVIGDGPSGEIVDRIRVLEDEDDITGITAPVREGVDDGVDGTVRSHAYAAERAATRPIR